jgi:hypothetical protein
MGIRRIAAGLAAIALCAGIACGDEPAAGTGDDVKPENLQVAKGLVVELVEATADAVAPDLAREPDPDNDRISQCEAEAGLGGHIRTQYGVLIDLHGVSDPHGLLERTVQFWEQEGYDVITRSIEASPVAAVFLDFDGFNFQMSVNPDIDRAVLGGSTPCFPAPENTPLEG